MFDPTVEKCWLIKPPISAHQTILTPEICLGESAGSLYFSTISEQGLQLWLLSNHTVSQWDLITTITLEELDTGIRTTRSCMAHFEFVRKLTDDQLSGEAWWVEMLGLKDNILLMRVGTGLYLYDIQKKIIKAACQIQGSMFFRMLQFVHTH